MAGTPPTVAERVAAGAYKNPATYPEKPPRPAVLALPGYAMTDDQAADLPRARAEYLAAMAAYERAKDAYGQGEGEAIDRFRADLEAEHGLTGHPKADAVWSKAWEDGHSYGLGEVAGIYGGLVELVL